MLIFFEQICASSMPPLDGICLSWKPELIWLHAAFDALTHVLSICTLWFPIYGIESPVKAVMAPASIFTAGMLWPLLPKLLTIPIPSELRRARAALEEEARQRQDAEQSLLQLRQSQNALRESAARLTAVFETATDGFIVIDARGCILLFNPACERLFGYRAAEVVHESMKMLMPEPYAARHDDYLERCLRTEERKIIGIGRELVGRRKDGSTFPLELSLGEAKQDGESIFVWIIHDLTWRRETEDHLQQVQKMEVVGQLAGGIAHDFNNLLTVIVVNTEQLSEAMQSRDDLQPILDDVRDAAQRGAELTRRMLAFSRKQLLRPVAIDCHELLSSMTKMLTRALREDIEVRVTSEPTALLALADRAQLESAVLNLAVNSQDAMPRGGILTLGAGMALIEEHDLSSHRGIAPGEYVVISVADDGEGMTAEVAARAFEPFFTTKQVGKGSGLGLSMVFGFAKQSNGHVTISSEPGVGTTIRVYLPRVIVKEQLISASAAGTSSPCGRETVLVVEDDPFVRPAVVRRVESLGYSVVVAVDGKDALLKLEADPEIDLLFTNVVVPGGMSGWELANLARRIRPDVPVMFTSGYPRETVIEQEGGFAEAVYITKPYGKAELAVRLREALAAEPQVSYEARS